MRKCIQNKNKVSQYYWHKETTSTSYKITIIDAVLFSYIENTEISHIFCIHLSLLVLFTFIYTFTIKYSKICFVFFFPLVNCEGSGIISYSAFSLLLPVLRQNHTFNMYHKLFSRNNKKQKHPSLLRQNNDFISVSVMNKSTTTTTTG